MLIVSLPTSAFMNLNQTSRRLCIKFKYYLRSTTKLRQKLLFICRARYFAATSFY
jgi:hypothetical protein